MTRVLTVVVDGGDPGDHAQVCDGRLHRGSAQTGERFRGLDLSDLSEAGPQLAEGDLVAGGHNVLDVRVLTGLGQLGHGVQLAVQVGDLLRDIADFHLVLGVLEKDE